MEITNINDTVAKYLSGNASEKEIKALDLWRQEPSNEQIFKELESIWRVSLAGKETVFTDTEQAWEKFSSMVREEPLSRFKMGKKAIYAISAAAAIIPFVIFIFFYQPDKSLVSNKIEIPAIIREEIPVESENVLITEVFTTDSIQQFDLPDGSKIWLNKHSRFSYPEKFTAAERIVNLEGEAFFEVEKETDRPFIIYTPTSITKVTGTSFNLKAYPGKEVEVFVVSGSVEFSSLNKPEATKVALRKNEKASLDNKTDLTTKKKNYEKETAWKKGPKGPKRFKRFMNKIRQFFKKQEKENIK